jgi:hypothetical protein
MAVNDAIRRTHINLVTKLVTKLPESHLAGWWTVPGWPVAVDQCIG